MDDMKEESEFGKGLSYCLALFLAHDEHKVYEEDYSLWFNGAADYLYELVIQETLSEELQNRLHILQDKCISWRMDDRCTKDNISHGQLKNVRIY
jgi:hypothetical protein